MDLIPPSPFSASPCATLPMPTGCIRCQLRAVPSSRCCHSSFAHLPTDNILCSKPSPNQKRQACPTVTPAWPWKAFSVQEEGQFNQQISDSFKLNLAKQSSCGEGTSTSSNHTELALLAWTRSPAQLQPCPKGHQMLPRDFLHAPYW